MLTKTCASCAASKTQRSFGNIATAIRRKKTQAGALGALLVTIAGLQIYVVRELFVAELLFALVFGLLLIIAGVAYIIGMIGSRWLDVLETEARALMETHRKLQHTESAALPRPLR
jgi:uncharacterized membrane protein HdeD (DUF308 family)